MCTEKYASMAQYNNLLWLNLCNKCEMIDFYEDLYITAPSIAVVICNFVQFKCRHF